MVMEIRQKQILVIEDQEQIARLIKWQLESVGFEVHTEHAGMDGLEYAAHHRPDLVILDLKLPDIHGFQVCRELRKLHHPWVVPILMLTGMDKPIDQLRGFAHGADAYLTKPFDISELLDSVALLAGQAVLN